LAECFFVLPRQKKYLHFTCLRGLLTESCFSLSYCLLPFVLTLKFLGLTFNSKDCLEPPIRHLSVKCERSLNISKDLSGRSWDGQRAVTLRLYRALIRLKVDYGRFVYGSAEKSKLSIKEAAQNAGLCLATGAFRSSRLEILQVESGEPPLLVRRNLLLCNYVARLAMQPVRPSYRAVFHHSFRYRWVFVTSAPRHVRVQLHYLLQRIGIKLPHVIPESPHRFHLRISHILPAFC
jgi:hypothetical protein